MKEIKLIPELDASEFPSEVSQELNDVDVSTHYQNEVISLEWSPDDLRFPLLQAWLVETYGEAIKQYDTIAIWST
jgi:hypothetical protein